MKYLFIGIADHPLLKSLAYNLKKQDSECKVDIISVSQTREVTGIYDNFYRFRLYEWYAKKIKKGSNFILTIMIFIWILSRRDKYDVIELHYVNLFNRTLIKYYKKISKKVIAVPWGSDIFRISKRKYSSMKKLLLQCDKINCITESMYQKIFEITDKKITEEKITSCRFGLDCLEEICLLRKKEIPIIELSEILELPVSNEKTIIITVGSNGSEGQQHLGIIESISKYNFENVFFIFPVTYGINDHYLSQISAALKNLKMPSVLLTEFMTSKQIASLRLLSSFFIQLQITDTLSGAMLEHLYAGSVVITGSWLKYDVLDKMGMYLQKVDHVSEIGDKLHSLISVFDSEKNLTNKNQKAVWELASWEYCLKNWKEL